MKKFIKRLFGIILGVILCCHNLCYADVIDISPIDGLAAGSMLLIPVGIIVFIIIMISYISLKVTAKNEETQGQINEDTQKKIEKDKKYLSICIFVLTIMISTIVYMLNRRYYPWIPIIPVIVLLIIAIIYRAKENKKISYILYAIAIAIFAVTCIYGNNIKNEDEERRKSGFYSEYDLEIYNSQFIAYEGQNKTASEVRTLYSAVIANNVSYEKHGISEKSISISGAVTLDKDNSSYKMPNLPNSKLYNIKIIYNKYGMIETIYIEEAN